MYKKTTTTVIEEADADFLNIKAAPVKSVFSNTLEENTGTGIAFRHSMMKYYNELVKTMREYLISKQYSPESTATVMEAIDKFKADTSSMFLPYLGPQAAPPVVSAQNDVISEIINILNLMAEKRDYSAAEQSARTKISDLDARLTSVFSPTVLPAGSVGNYWNSFLNSILEQTNSRMKNNWPVDFEALKNAYDIMVFGQPTGLVGFGDALARAIIRNSSGRGWV